MFREGDERTSDRDRCRGKSLSPWVARDVDVGSCVSTLGVGPMGRTAALPVAALVAELPDWAASSSKAVGIR